MIEITQEAAEQIKLSLEQEDTEGLALRVAATENADGSIHYGMGLDEPRDEDTTGNSMGVDYIIAPTSLTLLKDCRIDFVELEPGNKQFIFINPNDPDHKQSS